MATPTPADFPVSNLATPNLELNGKFNRSAKLLGDAGAAVPGTGGWFRSAGMQDKVVQLFANASPYNAGIGAAVVDIQATLAVDPVDPVPLSAFATIGTLNASTPFLAIDDSWFYIRAVVKTAGTVPVQVAIAGIGT